MVRFSYVQTPDYPLSDSIDMIKTADDLGFYACYSVDEIYHKDMWLLFAAAADKTRRIVAAMAEAAREGRGAVSLDGRLIDAASLRMAETLLHKLEQIEAREGTALAA